jgi:glycosyltransferase involved in cell wall biosynthesis
MSQSYNTIKHILILGNGYPSVYQPLDGVFNLDQAKAIAKANIKVGILSVNPISIKDILRTRKIKLGLRKVNEPNIEGFIYSYINIPGWSTFCIYMSRFVGSILFKRYQKVFGTPDLMHIHCFETGRMASFIKDKYNIPFIYTEHSSRFLLNKIPHSQERIIQRVVSESSFNIGVSVNLCTILSEKYGCPFHFIPNIVDTNKFKRDLQIKKSEKFTFFHAANFNSNKNQSDLIKAFAKISKDYHDVELVLGGGGPTSDHLVELVDSLNLKGKVNFLGWLTRSQIVTWYNYSHVFVLSSKMETFGVVLIEALSCGLPVVATKCGGPQSILKEDYLGELVEINADSIYLGMKKIYDNFVRYDSTRIRKFAVENFSEETVSDHLVDIYNTTLSVTRKDK